MGKATQSGFTLIELVVVIVILGILSAFAVPKFMGLESQARIAATNGLAGSVRSASALAHSVWMASGNTTPISVEGTNVAITNGYPSAADISKTLQDTTGFTAATVGTKTTFTKTGATTAASCIVEYTEAASGASPTILATTGGC